MSLIRSVATRALRPQLRAAQHQVLYRGFATAQADVQAAASAVLLHLDREAIGWTIDGQLDGAVQVVNSDFIVSGLGEDGTEKIAVSVAEEFDGFEEKFVMSVGEESVTVTDVSYATAMSPGLETIIAGEAVNIDVLAKSPSGFKVKHGEKEMHLIVRTHEEERLSLYMKKRSTVDTSKSLLAPMPGLLVSLAVEVGDSVAEGDEIAVVEAMKMQNVLKAEKAQVIKSIAAAPGDSLKVGETIVEFA